jgi:uncharacterized membrane protein YfcA
VEIILIAILSLVAGGVGTLTGFGTATIMVPVLLLTYSLPETLLLSGIVHWFGNLWKIGLFWSGLRWRLIFLFGLPGLLFTWIGASLVYHIEQDILAPLLGASLMLYTIFIFFNQSFRLPATNKIAVIGGTISGFMCGIFGVGGAIRGAFLSAFNLPKAVYISTAGFIGLIIDTGRLTRYLIEGTTISSLPLWSLLIFICASLAGAVIAKRLVDIIPQQKFRLVIMVFLFAVAIRYIVWG